MSATPRHRENVDRSKAEAARLLPGDPPRPEHLPSPPPRREPLFSRSAGKKRFERHIRAATFDAGAAMLKEICAYLRALGIPGTKIAKGAETIASDLERQFAPPVRK